MLETFEMACSLPVTLKEKLSNPWIRCLENLANSNVLPLSSYTVMEGRLANQHAQTSSNTPCQSWESVLSILGEEEAVDQNGELKLLPIFCTLPPVMQLRFIFVLQSNISQITHRTINTFLQQIETSQKNMWMKEAICQLRNTAAQCCNETNNLKELRSTKYIFTSEIQNAFEAVVRRLVNRKRCPWQQGPASSNLDRRKDEAAVPVINIPTPSNSVTAMRIHSDVSAMNSGPRNATHSLPFDEKAMDVIIIDDESTDSVTIVDHSPAVNVNNTVNIGKGSFGNLPDKNNCDIRKSDNTDTLDDRKNKQLTSESIHLVNQQFLTANNSLITDKQNPESFEQTPAGSSIHDFATNNKLNERKRKFTDIVIQNEELEHSAQKKCIIIDPQHEMVTLDSAAELANTQAALLDQPSTAADSEIKLPRNIMVYLDGIREACSHKENAGVVSKEMMDCFLDMNVAEINAACTYLELSQFSEKALVNVCDSISWPSLASDSSTALLNNCFSFKLRNLESPASRILLMSLVSVSRIQPQAVINVLADVIAVSKSGEFQCQVLTSVCKEFLSLDSFEYLIGQFSKEAIVVNENLVNVLQTLVEKCPNLTTDSVHYFYSVLTTTCQELSTSAKFGKLLMGVLTKYGNKMSNEQLTSMCALVETHNSSFRKPLLALVKRLTRFS